MVVHTSESDGTVSTERPAFWWEIDRIWTPTEDQMKDLNLKLWNAILSVEKATLFISGHMTDWLVAAPWSDAMDTFHLSNLFSDPTSGSKISPLHLALNTQDLTADSELLSHLPLDFRTSAETFNFNQVDEAILPGLVQKNFVFLGYDAAAASSSESDSGGDSDSRYEEYLIKEFFSGNLNFLSWFSNTQTSTVTSTSTTGLNLSYNNLLLLPRVGFVNRGKAREFMDEGVLDDERLAETQMYPLWRLHQLVRTMVFGGVCFNFKKGEKGDSGSSDLKDIYVKSPM